MQLYEGTLTDLRITSSQSGGGDQPVTSTFITLFNIEDQRQHFEYRSVSPPPIGEGEKITAVGETETGLVKVYALRNETTGWESKVHDIGKLFPSLLAAFFVFWCIVVFGMAIVMLLIFPLLAMVPLGMGAIAIWAFFTFSKTMRETRRKSLRAHAMIPMRM